MKDEILKKYEMAGQILADVMSKAKDMVKIGAPLLDLAEFVENTIREEGAQPAFPCNISRNDEAAHATPSAKDISVFGRDMVKLDIGVQVDGYIADAAITVDLSGNADLVEASREALLSAIEIIHAGTNTAEIGAAIESTIEGSGYKPVANLTGHGLARWDHHASPPIPNKSVLHGAVLKEGDIIAIEPFATNGAGHVSESRTAEIYRLETPKPVRLPAARKLLNEIEGYKMLPFAKRWLPQPRLDFILNQLERAGIMHSYPVLKDDAGGLVSQAEHTVIVEKDGCRVITK
ncbi:MAG: type II methionyl aminopeptidase [Methanocellales archaeon]|nr:type II methionyl aminopeptidase [Methanocellales archaeon]MDD3292308.1 type II methionyl aminopeptidase [Methanocellales archaeon]MDD5235582.1 type II methionyl aminopeptidase [Methanocellales archaeon]MDD5485772.1 type II methionyl aminopeptidase [Methanocellales archaeon]